MSRQQSHKEQADIGAGNAAEVLRQESARAMEPPQKNETNPAAVLAEKPAISGKPK